MTSHNSRPFIPSEANREEPRTLHHAWRKFYEPDAPPPPPMEVRNPFFVPPLSQPPPVRDWWNPPGHRPPPPVEGDNRRSNFIGPPSARGNTLPPPPAPRVYNPPYPGPPPPSVLDRPAWGVPRGRDWPERPLGSDHWSPGVVSSTRDRDRDRDRDARAPRGWGPARRAVSPPYLRAHTPLLEPSQAWKDRERQLSFEYGTPPVPSGSNVPDFQMRRFHQPAPPPPPPPPGRTNYNQFPPLSFPRRNAPRRRQQRISARISARPKREPSPSSSESSARSRSRSHSSRAPYIHLGRGHGKVEPAENIVAPVPSQKVSSSVPPPVPEPSTVLSSNFTFRPPTFLPRHAESPRRRSSRSPSWSPQSSIGSSVHSSPRLVATELEPAVAPKAAPDVADAEPVSAARTAPPSQEDSEFELPGMRFLKDGALKPGLKPPDLTADGDDHDIAKEVGDIEVDQLESFEIDQLESSEFEVADIATSGGVATEAPEHRQSPARDLSNESAHSIVLSPLSILSTSADHNLGSLQVSQSIPLSIKRSVESTSQDHDISQVSQTQEVAVETSLREASQTKPSHALDSVLAATESSPLSEPVPLSPPPDIPDLQEDVDEESSSELDFDSSSSSSPSSGPADNIAAALRVFVKARDGKDLQTRSERYSPILHANHALLDATYTRISTSNEGLVQEVLANSLPSRLEMHTAVSQTLLNRFTKQADEFAVRTQRLRAEYKSYHDRWTANCRKLDQSMASSASQGVEGIPVPSGRVTRRSAVFGDTVRSDLEMEQIIASLGNEDMTDPNVLAIRNTAVIPDLVSTDPFSADISFDDDNGIVDDPGEFFDMHDALGRWTDEEKQTFIQKYGVYPKQFGAIASFLPNKTPAQCVMFYYLHKKELIDFRAAISKYGPKRRRKGGRKSGKGKGNALLADIVKPLRVVADEEGISHKHSDRFLTVGCGSLPTRRPPPVQGNEGEASRPSAIIVERGTRVSAPHRLEKSGSNVDSAPSSQPRGVSTSITSFNDLEENVQVVPRSPDRPRIKQPNKLVGPGYRRPPPREPIIEPLKIGKSGSNVDSASSSQPGPVPAPVKSFEDPEENVQVVPFVPNKPRFKQACLPPRTPSFKDSEEEVHRASDKSSIKQNTKFGGPEYRPPPPRDPLLEPAKKTKPSEKGKEKEKRPPGRPPKKTKERANALERVGVSPFHARAQISYVWSKAEEVLYLKLIARHGKDFQKIAGDMPAKTALQCRNYFRNHASELGLEGIAQMSERVIPAKVAVSNSSSVPACIDKKTSKLGETNAFDSGGGSSGSQPRPSAAPKGKETLSTAAVSPEQLENLTYNCLEPDSSASNRLSHVTGWAGSR